MPISSRPDGKPVIAFDPILEVSPFVLFRRLQAGTAPRLIDVRESPRRSLRDAEPYPGDEFLPEPDEEVVLLDSDGSEALPIAHRLQSEGCERVKALFGGLELYEFALDPEVVGADTFLVSPDSPPE